MLARPTPRPACLPACLVIEFMSCSESWLHYQPRLRLPMAFNCTIYMQNVQSAALKILQPSPALLHPSLSTQITTGAAAAALRSKGLAQHSAKLKNFYKSALIPKTIKRATIATSSRLNKQQKKKGEAILHIRLCHYLGDGSRKAFQERAATSSSCSWRDSRPKPTL